MRVHRRCDQDRPVGGEEDGAGKIVGVAARHFRQQIGRRRRHHDEIGITRQTNVADVEFTLRIEQVGVSGLAGQRAGGEWRDEVLRGSGENAAHLGAAVLQPPDQIERFISGNAAADNKEDTRSGQAGGPRLSRRRLRQRRRCGMIGWVTAGILRRLAQDDPNLVLHRSARARGAEPQKLLEPLVELTNGKASHHAFLARSIA